MPEYLSNQEYEVLVFRYFNTNAPFSYPAPVLYVYLSRYVCVLRLSQPICCSLQSLPQLFSLFPLRHHIQTCFQVLKKNELVPFTRLYINSHTGFSGSKARKKSTLLLSTLPKYQTRCYQRKGEGVSLLSRTQRKGKENNQTYDE